MTPIDRLKAVYAFQKTDRLPRREFYIWGETIERWRQEGWDGNDAVFQYDSTDGMVDLLEVLGRSFLGWTEAPLVPPFEEKVIERTTEYEYYRLSTGEVRKYRTGGRTAMMPQFITAPVERPEDWHESVKLKLDPQTPERWSRYDEARMGEVGASVADGTALVTARVVGGYMFLRSLCGPEKLLYLFHDDPGLLHDMMKTWLHLASTCLRKVQRRTPFFRLYFGEDIAFKTGPLVSPQTVKDFLLPYYRELFEEMKAGQKKFLHIELDTDGNPDILLPLYIGLGVTAMSPCEMAADCHPVEIRKRYPDLVLGGGIDKRVLASGKDDIRRELDRVIPFMKARGGYIPMCDHGVPPDVSFENYRFYRDYITSIDGC